MSYIGTPPSNAFTSLLKQDFSTSATTGYTLDHAVNNANDIALFINFVRQEPTAGYAASGTTLTLTSATASSDDMYCVYLGQALQTVNPANVSVGTAQLIDGAVTGVKASGINTPAFSARLGSSQVVGNNSATKLAFNTEDLDTNGAYDVSNYRFTVPSGQAGTYVFTLNTSANSASDFEPMYGAIFLNGSAIQYGYGRNEYYDSRNLTRQLVLSVGNYVEAYLYQNSGGNVTVQTDAATNNFSGYKLST